MIVLGILSTLDKSRRKLNLKLKKYFQRYFKAKIISSRPESSGNVWPKINLWKIIKKKKKLSWWWCSIQTDQIKFNHELVLGNKTFFSIKLKYPAPLHLSHKSSTFPIASREEKKKIIPPQAAQNSEDVIGEMKKEGKSLAASCYSPLPRREKKSLRTL